MSPTRHPITLPDFGYGTNQVLISAWFVDCGETVFEGDPIAQALIPGMTFDIESPATGKLGGILKGVDSIVLAGDPIGWIENDSNSNIEGLRSETDTE